MKTIHLIPGAVGTDRIKLLVLAKGGQRPRLTLRVLPAGPPSSIEVTRSHLPPAVRRELARYDLTLYTAEAVGLAEATRYRLEAPADPFAVRPEFRTLPSELPADGLTIAVASCYYDGFHRAIGYLNALKTSFPGFQRPTFKLLIGDNLYVDVAKDQIRYSDGYRETVDRYVRYFWTSTYAHVLAHSPNFTTWDDHEFWNNYPEKQGYLARTWDTFRPAYEDAAQRCLSLFQDCLNPKPVAEKGRSYCFKLGQVSFFVADIRSNRDHKKGSDRPPEMFSEKELGAFETWAGELGGPGVLVLGQPMWLSEGSSRDWGPPDFKDQYDRLWRAIAEAPRDILIVSGDVHHSRLLRIALPNRPSSARNGAARSGYVYEFITSPACHIPKKFSIATLRYSVQQTSGVSYPAKVTATVPGVKLQNPEYVMGTEAANTVGLLHFRPAAGGAVHLDCAFVKHSPRHGESDLETPRLAEANPFKVDLGWWRSRDVPPFQKTRCTTTIRDDQPGFPILLR